MGEHWLSMCVKGLGSALGSKLKTRKQKLNTQALHETSSVTISERGAENTGGSTGQPDGEAETGEDIVITPQDHTDQMTKGRVWSRLYLQPISISFLAALVTASLVKCALLGQVDFPMTEKLASLCSCPHIYKKVFLIFPCGLVWA